MGFIIIRSIDMKTLTAVAVSIFSVYFVVTGTLLFTSYSAYETCRVEAEKTVLQKLNPGQVTKAVDTCNRMAKPLQEIISTIR